MANRLRWALVGFALAAVVAPARAFAQTDLQRFGRQIEQLQRETLIQANSSMSLDERALFDYGGYTSFGYLSADDNNNDNHGLRQYQIVGYARLNLDGAQEFFLRGRTGYNDFNKGDSFDGFGDQPIDPEMDRWFYRFDLARYEAAYYGKQIDYDLTIKAGRDLAFWGNGLVLSLDLQGLEIDGSWHNTTLTLLGGITPTRTVDFDASRPNFDHNTSRGFYGAMLSQNVAGQVPYVYALIQRDYNQDNVLETGPVTTKFDYESYYLGVGSRGPLADRLAYGIEAVYEGGTNLSNSYLVGGPFLSPVPQTTDQIQAYAADARLDYVFPDRRRSRLSAEAIIASGDHDRQNTSNTFGGNAPGTFDHAFNGFGLLNTGLAFAPAVSNLMAFRVGASQFPLPDCGPLRRLQIGTDIFFFNKYEKEAPIDEPTFNHRFLGWEPDIYLNWQVTSDVTFIFRYGIFFPQGDAFSSDRQRQFIFGGITYAF